MSIIVCELRKFYEISLKMIYKFWTENFISQWPIILIIYINFVNFYLFVKSIILSRFLRIMTYKGQFLLIQLLFFIIYFNNFLITKKCTQFQYFFIGDHWPLIKKVDHQNV